jgi:cobalt-zinc-cadmium efflux system protein
MGGHTHSAASANKHRLKIVFALTAAYLIAEVIGGIATHSLALLADAGHMLTDVAGLGLALLAIRFAERPATPERTYGYYRVEILAALANAVVLIGISVVILFEAYERLLNPTKIASGTMLAIACIGLVVNLVGIALLRKGSEESLNLKGAYFEVLSDMLTSVGVIVAAGIIWLTGWTYADPIVSAGIGLFILPRTWILLREAVGVLLEGTPSDVNLTAIREVVGLLPGVRGMHDLHVWTLTSGVNAMSAHVVVADTTMHDSVLSAVHVAVRETFEISHLTIQIENAGWGECEAHL